MKGRGVVGLDLDLGLFFLNLKGLVKLRQGRIFLFWSLMERWRLGLEWVGIGIRI